MDRILKFFIALFQAIFGPVLRRVHRRVSHHDVIFWGVRSPADGELIPMEEIPDRAFSSGMMGECLGILPLGGTIYAPVRGLVTVVAGTKHAVAFRKGKTEILVHVGLDTVKLKGKGFRLLVREGQTVEEGQPVLEMDPAQIRAEGFDPMVIVVRVRD